ncbi:hypothetical protein BDQ17DRAFT_1262344 [Cyathus striatus]|nr:hypothetical protein BDQ17DRAFT_1262344 [Cyathus striatus]
MQCHICGPAPDNVIFDGISISFSCKQLCSSIKPLTAISPHSEQKNKVSYVSKQQLILDHKLWKLIRTVMTKKMHLNNSFIRGDDKESMLLQLPDINLALGHLVVHLFMRHLAR